VAEIIIVNENENLEPEDFSKGYLTLPFDGDQFKDFITGLLGKPQTIQKSITGTFTIQIKDLQNFHELLLQRIVQQNGGALIQFVAKIYYDDNSSVQLGSYSELLTYNEVKPVISLAVQLSWVFLIKFADKPNPEKQTIDLLISTDRYHDFNEGLYFTSRGFGYFKITIQHTARSWGTDIENLLANQAYSCLIQPKGYKTWLKENDFIVSFILGMTIFVTCLFGGYLATNQFLNDQVLQSKAYTIGKSHTETQKIDFLIKYIASGVSTQLYFKLIIFLIFAALISFLFGKLIQSQVEDIYEPSFVILTKKS